MTGETNLEILLSSMTPELQPEAYGFVTLDTGEALPSWVEPLMSFREAEGTTLIVRKRDAVEARLDFVFPCRMITLQIHSSLEAVGFLAVITPRLAKAGMCVNPVSGYFHDYLFVPEDRVEEAMAILHSIVHEFRQN